MSHDVETEISRLTDGIAALRVVYGLINRGMDMDRLSEKLAKAAGVAKRQTDKIEARADALIAREADIEKRTDAAFVPHETILGDAERGLDAVEAQLRLLSNDPLGSSGDSQEVLQDGATFQHPG